MTRRATLAGLGAVAIGPGASVPARAGEAPLRLGVVGGLGFDAAGLSLATRTRWGRSAVPVSFPAWGSLADHAAVSRDGLIDGAVLPAEARDDGLAMSPDLRAVLLLRTARPRRIGLALRHPRSEAALRDLLPDGSALTLVAMPPAMLVGNLQAGLIDAALLLGVDPLATPEAGIGLKAVPLCRDVAAALLPRLAIRLRPGPREAPSA